MQTEQFNFLWIFHLNQSSISTILSTLLWIFSNNISQSTIHHYSSHTQDSKMRSSVFISTHNTFHLNTAAILISQDQKQYPKLTITFWSEHLNLSFLLTVQFPQTQFDSLENSSETTNFMDMPLCFKYILQPTVSFKFVKTQSSFQNTFLPSNFEIISMVFSYLSVIFSHLRNFSGKWLDESLIKFELDLYDPVWGSLQESSPMRLDFVVI